jgi:hypothetical protein
MERSAFFVNGNDALLVPFSGHLDGHVPFIDVIHIQTDQFSAADAAAVEEFQYDRITRTR